MDEKDLEMEFESVDNGVTESESMSELMAETDSVEPEKELSPEVSNRISENIRKRQKRRSRPSPLKIALGVIILSVAIMVFMSTGVFTIDSIQVEGNEYFTDEEIINMAHASTGKNLFYHSGSREIVDYLEESPYIEEAKVSKKIPGTLVITVKEREQLAAIVYNKEYLIVDSEGLLLRRSETKPKITILTGIKVKKIQLGEKIQVEDSDKLKDALQILQVMKEGDLYFKKIEMKDKTIRAYVYDALICKGDADTITDAIQKERLQKVLETLFKKGIKRGTVTLTKKGYASFEPKV